MMHKLLPVVSPSGQMCRTDRLKGSLRGGAAQSAKWLGLQYPLWSPVGLGCRSEKPVKRLREISMNRYNVQTLRSIGVA